MNKKANVIDIILSPTFATIVALGIVGLTLWNAVSEIGTSKAYDEKIFSARNALIRDALAAIPKDTNAYIEVTMPTDIRLDIEQHSVKASYGKAGHTFFYTKSPAYRYIDASFKPNEKNSPLIHYKIGNTIGTESIGLNPTFKPNLIIPYCEPSRKALKILPDKKAIADYGTTTIQLLGGEANIYAKPGNSAEPILKIYTSSEPESAHLACFITQKMLEEFPTITATAIIPVNKHLVTDDRAKLTGISLLIELTVPLDAPTEKAKFLTAVFSGVNEYGAGADVV